MYCSLSKLFIRLVVILLTLASCSKPQQTTNQNTGTNPKTQPVIKTAAILPPNTPLFTGSYGATIYGNLKYPQNFSHFDYVNPNAPKGGTLHLAQMGGFNSLNQFIIRGNAATGLERIYDTLLHSSADEPHSKYGLIAKSIKQEKQAVEYTLRPEAKFSNGQPLTASDVKFTFETLVAKGNPLYKAYYQDVAKVVVKNPHLIRFEFSKANRELPFILGEFPILPRHYWQEKDFNATTLAPPVGSGPYIIGKVDAGKSIVFLRNADYWGNHLSVNKGRHNFDQIKIDYYRSEEVLVEAFKGGKLDFRQENSAKRWNKAYKVNSDQQSNLVQLTVQHNNPTGMQGFVFNARKTIFNNRLVRQALQYAFDFEFINKHFMHSSYQRTASYFENSYLASSNLPQADELELLQPFKEKLPTEVFTTTYQNPKTAGDGFFRQGKKTALDLLAQAGWHLKNGKLVNAKNKVFRFNILILSKSMERIVMPFVRNLAQIGIEAQVTLLETGQYIQRIQNFNFDMVVFVFGQSLSPGNEQRNYWGSAAADRVGSRNIIGIKSTVIDTLIEKIITAENQTALTTATRALDRVLLWQFYVIPHFHSKHHRLVYWQQRLAHPQYFPAYQLDMDSWWHKQNSN